MLESMWLSLFLCGTVSSIDTYALQRSGVAGPIWNFILWIAIGIGASGVEVANGGGTYGSDPVVYLAFINAIASIPMLFVIWAELADEDSNGSDSMFPAGR